MLVHGRVFLLLCCSCISREVLCQWLVQGGSGSKISKALRLKYVVTFLIMSSHLNASFRAELIHIGKPEWDEGRLNMAACPNLVDAIAGNFRGNLLGASSVSILGFLFISKASWKNGWYCIYCTLHFMFPIKCTTSQIKLWLPLPLLSSFSPAFSNSWHCAFSLCFVFWCLDGCTQLGALIFKTCYIFWCYEMGLH